MNTGYSGMFRRFGQSAKRLVVISLAGTLLGSQYAPAEAARKASEKPGDFFSMARSIDLLGDVYKEVSQNYVDPVDVSEFMYSGIDGMLEHLDPYTTFLDEAESDELDEITTGRYAGIGIMIGTISGELYVTSVFEGQAAQKSGIETGDRIIAVNDIQVNNRSIDEVRGSIKGPPGTIVRLSVRKDGTGMVKEYTLTRSEVRVSTVPFSALFGSVAYVRLNSFGEHSAEELRTAILEMQKKASGTDAGMNGMVLDLRGNPGGLLESAVEVAALFVEKGSRVVSIKGRSARSEQVYVTKSEPIVPQLPLVVLIDSESASASEIVAGAIQELDRGVIVGEGSFGKGLVQSVITLPYDHSLKLTTAKYYTPSGRLIQKAHTHDDGRRKVVLAVDTRDSTKVFYTRNRRMVYGGGGIKPDVVVRSESPTAYERALDKEGLLFGYASRFHLNHPGYQISKLSGEPLFEEFSNYIRTERFVYRSKLQKDLDSLKTVMQREGSAENSDLSGALNAFENSLAAWTLSRISQDSTRITAALRREITRRYDEPASMRLSVENDPVAVKAFSLIAEPKSYQVMLRP